MKDRDSGAALLGGVGWGVMCNIDDTFSRKGPLTEEWLGGGAGGGGGVWIALRNLKLEWKITLKEINRTVA